MEEAASTFIGMVGASPGVLAIAGGVAGCGDG